MKLPPVAPWMWPCDQAVCTSRRCSPRKGRSFVCPYQNASTINGNPSSSFSAFRRGRRTPGTSRSAQGRDKEGNMQGGGPPRPPGGPGPHNGGPFGGPPNNNQGGYYAGGPPRGMWGGQPGRGGEGDHSRVHPQSECEVATIASGNLL